MVYSKHDLFNKELQSQARVFKALAHPARLAILQYLAETKTCITGNIADELPLSRTTVNQHLTELKNSGLIHGTTEGVKTNYCLNPCAIKELRQTINRFTDSIDISTINC